MQPDLYRDFWQEACIACTPCGPTFNKEHTATVCLSEATTEQIPELTNLRATAAQSALLNGQSGAEYFTSSFNTFSGNLTTLLQLKRLYTNANTLETQSHM
jgi:hypothetical protein